MDFIGAGPFDHSDAAEVVYDFISELTEAIDEELASPCLESVDLPEIHTKMGILISYLELPVKPQISDMINASEWRRKIEFCFSVPDRWSIAGWPSENKEVWKSGILKTISDIEELTKL